MELRKNQITFPYGSNSCVNRNTEGRMAIMPGEQVWKGEWHQAQDWLRYIAASELGSCIKQDTALLGLFKKAMS